MQAIFICQWLIEAASVYGQMHACLKEETPAGDRLMCKASLARRKKGKESLEEALRGRPCSRAHLLGSVVSASR